MRILIIDKASGDIASQYDAEAPAQESYGGPWGNPDWFTHMECPEDVDPSCAVAEIVEGEIELSEDSDKVQARRDAKLEELRVRRNSKLDECDVMINELVLALRSDTAAIAAYRQALLDLTDDYKKVDGHAKAAIDSLDLDDIDWPEAP